jgi:hypothetical protein
VGRGEAERLGLDARQGGRARRSSPRSASASSGCCASSRSSRSSTAPGATIGVEEVEARAAPRPSARSGASPTRSWPATRAATRAFLELRAQGETLPRLVPLMARRVRDVLAIAARLEAGESPAQVKASLKGSPWAADRRIKEARATDAEALRARSRRSPTSSWRAAATAS